MNGEIRLYLAWLYIKEQHGPSFLFVISVLCSIVFHNAPAPAPCDSPVPFNMSGIQSGSCKPNYQSRFAVLPSMCCMSNTTMILTAQLTAPSSTASKTPIQNAQPPTHPVSALMNNTHKPYPPVQKSIAQAAKH